MAAVSMLKGKKEGKNPWTSWQEKLKSEGSARVVFPNGKLTHAGLLESGFALRQRLYTADAANSALVFFGLIFKQPDRAK